MHQKLLANTGYEKKGYGKVKRGWLEWLKYNIFTGKIPRQNPSQK
jgi:hypothetical protein